MSDPTPVRRPPARRFAGVFVTAALVASCGTTQLTLDNNATGTGRLASSVASPLKGERFDVTGDIGSTGPRDVVLERRQENGWRAVPGRRAIASTTGNFEFKGLSISGPTKFRARAAKATVNDVERSAISTAQLALTPASRGQRATLRTLPEIAGSPDDRPASMAAATGLVEARFSPARPGRTVEFAGRVGTGEWRAVGTATQDAEGKASIEFADTSAPTEWRARSVASNGVKAFEVTDEPDSWTQKLGSNFNDAQLPKEWDYRQLKSWLPSRTCMLITEDGVDLDGSVAGIRTARMNSIPKGVSGKAPRKALQEQRCVDATNQSHLYESGMISTAESFRFVRGIAAARVRFDERAGQHGAFWLQTNEPNDTEIDVVESFGRSKQPLSVTLHQTNDNENQLFRYKPKLSDLGPRASDWFDEFHIYSVEWTKNEYVFRIDGREIFRAEQALSDAPHYVVLSNIVADYEIPKNDGTGATMEVDWVRVWQ